MTRLVPAVAALVVVLADAGCNDTDPRTWVVSVASRSPF
jgi:hypothetical protein